MFSKIMSEGSINMNEINELRSKFGLNIGCGTDIREGYINLDKAQIPGVDIIWDITQFPYPFEENRFRSIILINVLEHLPDTVSTMEEIHRISKPGARITIRVPFWNSIEQATDPTHVSFFSDKSMDYLDIETQLGNRRAYYSKARFRVKRVTVWVETGKRWVWIRNRIICNMLFHINHYIPNIARLIEYDLECTKAV